MFRWRLGDWDAAHRIDCCDRAWGGVRARGACRRHGGVAVYPSCADCDRLQLARLLSGRQHWLVACLVGYFVVDQSNWILDRGAWRDAAVGRGPDIVGFKEYAVIERCRRR